MARRDSLILADVYPFTVTTVTGAVDSQSIRAPHAAPGAMSHEDLGGPIPWGCDQQEPAAHDQA